MHYYVGRHARDFSLLCKISHSPLWPLRHVSKAGPALRVCHLRWLQQHALLLLHLLVAFVLLVVVGVVVVVVIVVVVGVVVVVASILLWRRLTGTATATTPTVHGLHFSRIRVCMFIYLWLFVCMYDVGGERALAAESGGSGRLNVGWSVLQKFSTTRLFSIFPQRADAVCCCCFFLLPFLFGTVLSLSLFCLSMAFWLYVHVRVCVYTYVGALCVLVFALPCTVWLFI